MVAGTVEGSILMSHEADLPERQLMVIFDAVLDTDKDGVITAADFTQLARGLCEQLGVPEGPKVAAFERGYLSWWEQIRAACDGDGDGRVTRAEFTAAHRVGQGDPQAFYQEQVGRMVALVAEAADTDGDGFIELAEYERVFRLADVGPDVVLAGFERLDTDGDGRVSTQEFLAGIAHLFLSQDPADLGTSMLGLV
jgi:Ca2+-binding EF-hand superfamily protein